MRLIKAQVDLSTQVVLSRMPISAKIPPTYTHASKKAGGGSFAWRSRKVSCTVTVRNLIGRHWGMKSGSIERREFAYYSQGIIH